MTSIEAMDQAEATEPRTHRRRRGGWIAIALIVALFVGTAVWQGVARVGRIETGPASISQGGLVLPDCIPHGDFWAAFDETEDVVVAHTVSNPSLWPVTVISTDPEVYRFEPLDDDPAQDSFFRRQPHRRCSRRDQERRRHPAGSLCGPVDSQPAGRRHHGFRRLAQL